MDSRSIQLRGRLIKRPGAGGDRRGIPPARSSNRDGTQKVGDRGGQPPPDLLSPAPRARAAGTRGIGPSTPRGSRSPRRAGVRCGGVGWVGRRSLEP
uniref:Uncharacterized protein n=1 Tax=Oryza brachyantha TaxID=4533 RepID=J3MWD8_ORYBR